MRCAGRIIAAASDIGAEIVVVSEYGLTAVDHPVHINRILRQSGWLAVRDGPYGEMLMPGESKAFAVADHQVAHIYLNQPDLLGDVRRCLEAAGGIDRVVEPSTVALDHPRSGELIALAKPNAWFTYYYWMEDQHAPDFARTVDIHRKPGYDPCELFLTSKVKAFARVAQKKLGFRYKMDVIPLDATLVRGSHGLPVQGDDGPMIIGPGQPPNDMRGLKDYVRGLLSSSDSPNPITP